MHPHLMNQLASQHADELRLPPRAGRSHVSRPGPRNSVRHRAGGRWSRSGCAWPAAHTMADPARDPLPREPQGGPDHLPAAAQPRPAPRDRQGLDDLQAAACLGERRRRRQDRGLRTGVGDRAHHLAGPAPQEQLDLVRRRALRAAVQQRIGDQLGHDHRGVLGQHRQPPAPQDLPGELARSPARQPRVPGRRADRAANPAGRGEQRAGP